MNPLPPIRTADVDAAVARLTAAGEPFAIAVVVRTVAATSAKAGAKAVISADGEIVAGWVGGACARGAVGRAGARAIASGEPELLSIRPKDLLDDDIVEGAQVAQSMCPSRGSIDLFVEPFSLGPRIAVEGESPVAVALVSLSAQFGYRLTDLGTTDAFTVIATQGKGDLDALRLATRADCRYVAFVGSRAKWATLKARLLAEGVPAGRLDAIHAPAGLDLSAVTPEEIALSIMAEITQMRRRGDRPEARLTAVDAVS